MSEGFDAAIFYVSVGALVAGAIRAVRSATERRAHDRLGLILAAAGAVGLAAAVVLFVTGAKSTLPF